MVRPLFLRVQVAIFLRGKARRDLLRQRDALPSRYDCGQGGVMPVVEAG
jgi:hypothetical protein